MKPGDRMLVCSDGLSSVVQPARLAELMDQSSDISTCADALIEAANDAGGPDNITVILVEIGGQSDVA